MKLLLQVVFAQGYLWRDRFPESFPDGTPHGSSPQPLWLAFALVIAASGSLALYHGSVLFGPVLLLTGLSLAVWSADSLGLKTRLGSRAFWTSVSWASGTLTTLGFAMLLPLSVWAAIADPLSFPFPWCWLVASACYMVFFGSVGLHVLGRRYLFFAEPRKNAHLLEEPNFSPGELWLDTYWNFPRRIIAIMLSRPSPDTKEERHA
jgi:hypothetical protein